MEILFKGQRIDGCGWTEGSLIANKHMGVDKYFIATNGMGQIYATSFEATPESVCQFTGLYDATNWQDLTEEQRDKWTLDGNMPSGWKGLKLFSDDVISDGTRTIRIYMTEGGFAIKAYYWASDIGDLGATDELILQPLPDAQTRSWIEGWCKLVGNIHDKNKRNEID